ncbi:MAG: beta-N-acetylhexosaminidase [Candidatus Sulfotelmatobacter sp.]
MARRKTRTDKRELGQLLIVGFDGTKMTPHLGSLLTRLQPAGVILFARNIGSAEQTWQLLRDCRKCVSAPLLTCVDMEGGTVDRFRDVLGPTPSAADVFATGDRKLFRKHSELIGESCHALGFNLDFAPMLDLAFEASRKILGSRAVSVKPNQTIGYARQFLLGLRSTKVLGCGKHFPGLGAGTLDSHHELPVIEKSLKKLWTEDLLPYRFLRSQLPMVMISHAAYPDVTKKRVPASLSKIWITDILRKRIRYCNLIVSDDLEMGGVLSSVSPGQAAVEFIRAGGDLCLICHREDRILESHEALAAEAERNPDFARRVTESLGRIAEFKIKSARLLRPPKQPSAAVVERLSRKLWEFGEQVRLEALVRQEKGRERNLIRRPTR